MCNQPDKGTKRKKDAKKGFDSQGNKRRPAVIPDEPVEPGLGISEEERKRIIQMVEDEPEVNKFNLYIHVGSMPQKFGNPGTPCNCVLWEEGRVKMRPHSTIPQ